MPRGLLALLLTACLLAPCLALATSELDEKAQRLKQVKSRIQSLHQQLVSTESQRDKQSLALQETEKQIGEIARRIRVTGQSLRRQQRQLAGLEAERADARLNLDKHQSTLERQIRAAYAMGRQEKVKILLNQQDPAVVSRVMVYYDYFNEARIEQMGIIEESLKTLNRIEREISREETRLQQLQAKNRNESQQLEAAQEGRRQIIATLDRQLQDKGKELTHLKQDESQLQSLISNIQEALSDIPLGPAAHEPFRTRKGKLPWPSRGRLVANFGTKREVGKLTWDGVMIAAPEGREVRAIHHGRVAFADWLRGFGLLLIIDHGDGYMSLYGHNQSLFKETGEWVEPGEVVAQVGSSGGRSTSGVYFGIRHNGSPQNPKKWCKRVNGRRVSHWMGAVPGTLTIEPGSQQHRNREHITVVAKS
ncbi:MAG: peptidoglycan DD-metalloendopeptidase family protein [Candidatus Thiodiazotropha sp. (ex Monitilora ramsayi)]|nr:peptidoglycan DD-metalloendopeptidase family protein [Candidatus Thiodiazotropha sp. (ex Monitilora ramsayi)]